MAQTYIKQLVLSWLRMVHREIIDYRHIRIITTNYQRTTCLGGSLFFLTLRGQYLLL